MRRKAGGWGDWGEGGGVVLECGRCMLCTCFCFCEAERTGVQRGLHVSEPKRMREPGVAMSAGRGCAGKGCMGGGLGGGRRGYSPGGCGGSGSGSREG